MKEGLYMVDFWEITMPELTGDEPRRAYIYLPDYYEEEQYMEFPVLYMFDGHNLFFDDHATYGKSWGMAEYMDASRLPFIIAAIECNHDPDNGRLCEYSPFDFTDRHLGSVTGKGKLTMDYIVNEFKPYIDSNFRTLPDRRHTFIAGSSMGGLMSLYALMEYNEVFSGAAALSPSLWVSPKKVEAMVRDAELLPDTSLYMDYGSEELKGRYHAKMAGLMGRIGARLITKGVYLNSRIVPGGTHCEACWEKQIPYFMDSLCYPFMCNEED